MALKIYRDFFVPQSIHRVLLCTRLSHSMVLSRAYMYIHVYTLVLYTSSLALFILLLVYHVLVLMYTLCTILRIYLPEHL